MRGLALLSLFPLAACTGDGAQTPTDQLNDQQGEATSIEERLKPARDLMADDTKGVRDRYEEAITWCLNDGYPNEFHCAGNIARMAEAALAKELVQHRKTAQIVNRAQAEELAEDCTPEAMLLNKPAFNLRCEQARFSDRLEQSQESWQKFSELQCSLEASNSLGGWGEHANLDFCLTRLAGARIEGLQSMMEFYERQYLPLEEISQ